MGRGGQQLGRAPPKNWQLAAIVVALFALPWLSAITLIGWLLPQGLAPWVLALPIVLYGTGLFLLTIAGRRHLDRHDLSVHRHPRTVVSRPLSPAPPSIRHGSKLNRAHPGPPRLP